MTDYLDRIKRLKQVDLPTRGTLLVSEVAWIEEVVADNLYVDDYATTSNQHAD